MAPIKKSKANPEGPIEQQQQQQQQQQQLVDPQPSPDGQQPQRDGFLLEPEAGGSARVPTSSATRPSSWYGGGSWRAKASPVAQIARESISVAKGATSESSDEPARRPSQSVSKSVRGSRKSVPLVAEPTRIHATSDALDKSRPRFPSEEKLRRVEGTNESTSMEPKITVEESAPLPPEPTVEANGDEKSLRSVDERPQSWFGWWSRPDGYGSDGDKGKASNKRRKLDIETASGTPLPGSPTQQPADAQQLDPNMPDLPSHTTIDAQEPQLQSVGQWEGVQPGVSSSVTAAKTWFRLWSTAQNQQAAADAQALEGTAEPAPVAATSTDPAITVTQDTPKPDDLPVETDRPKASGWVFWSQDQPQKATASPGDTQKEVGEIAVADTPSQSHPEAAQFNEQREEQRPQATAKRTDTLLGPKRGRADRVKDQSAASSAATPSDSKAHSPASSQAPSESGSVANDLDMPLPVKRWKVAQSRPNLVLPLFQDTYPTTPNLSYLERLATYLAQTLRLPGSEAPPVAQHVYISPAPPKVRKAIAIGVHGFFPAAMFARVFGQPTGTSIRFASYAAASIKAWCQGHQPEISDVQIDKVALEGEGLVDDRVSTLWKLLLNWLSHLRQADFILVAAHSQGVPVGITLLAKLIQLGCLSPHVRLGVCAIAGINLGPFLEYKSRLLSGSALELFDFCDPFSKVSKSYNEALDICLRHGVRVTFVGALDDQLVSLESSLYAPLSHPYVSRAVFVDGRLHVLNFLTHLVVFALKLRNLGVSDHGLLRELSLPLAGSLVGGEGHSRVYDDAAVYRLAVDFALETTDATPSNTAPVPTAAASLLATDKDKARSVAAARRIAPLIAHYEPPLNGGNNNPFYLPWAVRGMLEEEMVKRDSKLQAEVAELVKEFEEWQPTSKVLKDVRWRLEGVRNIL
ncbi:hypothetical protein BAUCODRAFT_105292 [Baudoinia panamericana UAMH 10762]|uniref:YMC020W-like alpha/beta hydrolase domain-containing protein n=1 Tax=Baudoinia panamericana (strain UAMH 10762) TaxID=717646 RepID=M2NFY3_BAUPA|nr:uncharacterized protein BAUCODRAFT_105292 [Baudoinia panamericana UAMH 10762]EMC98189.1 hypothetical protein BAUCODRAFT_105292 [Baudoinia panamericana UAMH 10762]